MWTDSLALRVPDNINEFPLIRDTLGRQKLISEGSHQITRNSTPLSPLEFPEDEWLGARTAMVLHVPFVTVTRQLGAVWLRVKHSMKT